MADQTANEVLGAVSDVAGIFGFGGGGGGMGEGLSSSSSATSSADAGSGGTNYIGGMSSSVDFGDSSTSNSTSGDWVQPGSVPSLTYGSPTASSTSGTGVSVTFQDWYYVAGAVAAVVAIYFAFRSHE